MYKVIKENYAGTKQDIEALFDKERTAKDYADSLNDSISPEKKGVYYVVH